MNSINIRRAESSDSHAIAAFNRAMARETENIELIPETISAGVNAIFENPARGFYIVAEIDSNAVGAVCGSGLIPANGECALLGALCGAGKRKVDLIADLGTSKACALCPAGELEELGAPRPTGGGGVH